jgi:hypothetical protein
LCSHNGTHVVPFGRFTRGYSLTTLPYIASQMVGPQKWPIRWRIARAAANPYARSDYDVARSTGAARAL